MIFDINNYKGNYVMHCKTEEEAKDFLKYLHSVGERWHCGDSYLEKNHYKYYKNDTAYNFNLGSFADTSWYKSLDYNFRME